MPRFLVYSGHDGPAAGVTDGQLIWAVTGTVLVIVRAGLPAALELAVDAVTAAAVARVADVRLLPPLDAPTFSLTNPYALVGAGDDVIVRPAASCSTSSVGSPRSSNVTAATSAWLTPARRSSATPSSTTGRRVTCSGARWG